MFDKVDNIELAMPFKAEYVSVVRLTASGIASRLGFDIDTIEDIKVSVAEVCNKLVQKGSTSVQSYKIIFRIFSEKLQIDFSCEDSSLSFLFSDENDVLGMSIVTALMDETEIHSGDTRFLSMTKVLEGIN